VCVKDDEIKLLQPHCTQLSSPARGIQFELKQQYINCLVFTGSVRIARRILKN
jgi:hypothetical protein